MSMPFYVSPEQLMKDRADFARKGIARGRTVADDQIYRLTYDGQVADEHGYAAMGGSADSVTTHIKDHYREGMTLAEAVRVAVDGLGSSEAGEREILVESLEVAVLDRTRTQQRKFRRLSDETLAGLLEG